MRARVPHSLVCLGLMLAAFSLRAASSITTDSPFLPPSNGTASTAVTEGAVIELHGIMTTPEGTSFSIYDTVKKSAQWVRLNQAGSPFVVRSHAIVDGNDEVKVDYQGSALTLALKTPKIGAMARPAPNAPQPPIAFNRPGGPPNPITQTVVTNPTPADEAARLQAVVEAVAARRAARNQATQQQNGAPPAQIQMGPMQTAPQTQGQNGNGQRQNRQRQNQR